MVHISYLNNRNTPLYTKVATSMWLYDSLEASRDRYFPGWIKFKYTNEGGTGTGLWFVDHEKEALADCKEGAGRTCGHVVTFHHLFWINSLMIR